MLSELVGEWAITRAAGSSDQDVVEYLRPFYNGKPVAYSIGQFKRLFGSGVLRGS